jgi:hypothetical protein
VFAHVLRCFCFALALLHTGFPSGTPGVAQIGFEELSVRLYHTSLLHDLAFSNNTEVLAHPVHAMAYNNSLFLSDIHYPEFVFPNIASPKISLTKKTLPKIPYRKFAVSIPLETNSTQLPYREIRGQDRLRII